MTTHDRELVPRTHVIDGTPEQVHNALATQAAQGRLNPDTVHVTAALGDGRIRVQAVLLEPAPEAAASRRVPGRWDRPVAAVVVIVPVLLGAGWMLSHLAPPEWLAELVREPVKLLVGAIVAVLGLVALVARIAGGGRLPHCPGPWHR